MNLTLDNRLILEFQKGKHDAFEQVYRYFYPKLVDFGWRMTGSVVDAEDIAQAAFMKLFEICEKFSEANHIQAFLYTAIRNLSLNYLRDQKTKSEKHKVIAEEMQNDMLLAYDYEISDPLYSKIQVAIENLPDGCRKIFKLIYIEEMTPTEVAEILKISPSTIYTQRNRALEFLRFTFRQDSLALAIILQIILEAQNHSKVVIK